MSGRSAYVRKKITTEASRDAKSVARDRTRSAASNDRDHVTISDFPLPLPATGSSMPVGTGVGTTNARFLKFSEPARDPEEHRQHQQQQQQQYQHDYQQQQYDQPPPHSHMRRNMSTMSISSGSTGSAGHRPDNSDYPDYDRPRRPTLNTEDVSGIERSGLRSLLDKKSDGVRKGLAKTFTFKKKDRHDARSPEFRPPSVATIATVRGPSYHPPASSPSPPHDFQNSHFGPPDPMPVPAPRQQSQSQGPEYLWDPSAPTSPPPAGRLPPLPQPPAAMAPHIKRWIGSGRPVQRWNKLRKDPELWDPNGDVLVFFGHRGQQPRPNPSFRLSSHIIEATESRYLVTMLREGSTEEDLSLPPSPQGAPPMLRHAGGGGHHHHRPGHHLHPGHPTPPVSEDTSLADADGQISYEMYFPTPVAMSKVDQLRHHITTRNFFALLYHASLVGISLHQALSDLHARLDAYLPSDSDNVAMLINYLTARSLDDVRADPETAVGLLAWAEGPDVRWEDGWRECFLHCAGMYSRLEQCADFRSLTPITRALLERACLETQLRVQAAEERLIELQCHEMWPSSGPVATGPAKAAADRLQKFLLSHYTRIYGCWPPVQQQRQQQGPTQADPLGLDGEGMWLTRTVAQALQADFGALYDYLVHRDIVWDVSEARSGRKWMMVSEAGNRGFEADTPDLPLTDMLIEFDNKMRFPHIPHPYPLVPESIAPTGGVATKEPAPAPTTSSSMFRSSKKAAAPPPPVAPQRSGAMERRVQLAYTEATNIYSLGTELTHSELVDAFAKFEKTDHIGEVDPAVARRGRWALIYGILQTLASVSVDSPGARYREGVPYHLSPRLKGTRIPPWKGTGKAPATRGAEDVEASHELSHCWVVAGSWQGEGRDGASSGGEEESGGGGHFPPLSLGGYSFPRSPTGMGGGGWQSGGWVTPAGRSAQSGNDSSAPSVVSETSSRPGVPGVVPGALPIRSREFGGYHEGTHGVYGTRSQGQGQSRSTGYGSPPEGPPQIRDFDLDVIDVAEPWRGME